MVANKSDKTDISGVRGENAVLKIEYEKMQKELSEYRTSTNNKIRELENELKTTHIRLKEQSKQILSNKRSFINDKENNPMKTRNYEGTSKDPTVHNELTTIKEQKNLLNSPKKFRC